MSEYIYRYEDVEIAIATAIKQERERRTAWLNRVRTWYPEKADIWYEGYETAEERIIKLLEEQLAEYTLPNGTVYIEFIFLERLIALIKGEK